MKNKKKSRRSSLNLRLLLFASIALFIVFALVSVWLVQMKLLGFFFRMAKYNDMERVADVIESNLEDESLDTIAYQYAVDYGVCVRLMRVDGSVAYEKLSVDVVEDCVLHHITDEYVSRLYYGAKGREDKEYTEQHTRADLYDQGLYYPQFSFSPDKIDRSDKNMQTESAIYVRLVSDEQGTTYAIMLDVEMTPMSAISTMLSSQFLLIVSALLFGALMLAIVLSKLISAPIERMNRSAKLLARGNYDVDFSGDGFVETHELADTLNYAASELSKTDRLQKELIANISHDLRTPLTMITGYSEVMRDIPGENTPENVQVIIDEANRLSELVSALLDLSKLQAGASSPEVSSFDLTETVKAAMGRYAKLTEHYGYRIEFYSDCSVQVLADRSMILQVLYNLLNNAINYIGEDKLVVVTQTVTEGRVRISVADHGVGIEADQLPYIWERYYKVDKVHRRATAGTGIGLSIVKGVLEAHGAGYGVDSTPGEGSSFWFELPLADAGEDAPQIH